MEIFPMVILDSDFPMVILDSDFPMVILEREFSNGDPGWRTSVSLKRQTLYSIVTPVECER